MKILRLSLWFFFGFLLGGAVSYAHAETPVTQWSYAFLSGWYTEEPGGHCAQAIEARNAGLPPEQWGTFVEVDVARFMCRGTYPNSGSTLYDIAHFVSRQWCTTANVSPTNGVCPATDVCATKAGQSAGRQTMFSGYDVDLDGGADAGNRRESDTLCFDGCTIDSSYPQDYECFSYVGAASKIYCEANYAYTGASCTAGTDPLGGDSGPAVPNGQAPCPPGYTLGTVNGDSRCLPVGAPSPKPPAPATSSTTENTVTNPDNSTTTTTTTTNSDGSKTVTTTTTNPDGSKSSTTTTTSPAKEPENPVEDFCKKNPNALMCKSENPSSGVGSGGLGSWYTKEGVEFSDKLQEFVDKTGDLPLFSSVGNFFTVTTGGACPVWTIPSVAMPFGTLPSFSIDVQCNMEGLWPFIAAIVMASGAWLAWRIALL